MKTLELEISVVWATNPKTYIKLSSIFFLPCMTRFFMSTGVKRKTKKEMLVVSSRSVLTFFNSISLHEKEA
jgi:hypothetical protein